MKVLKLLFCLLVSGFCLLLIFRKVDLAATFRLFKLTRYDWLLAATFLGICKSWLTGFRWRYLAPANQRLPLKDSFHFYGIGVMINMTLPFRVGDLTRSRLIAESLKIPNTHALGTIVSEHILDFSMLCCLLIACFAFYSYHWPAQVLPIIVVFFMLIFSFLCGLFFWKRKKNIPLLQSALRYLSAVLPKPFLFFSSLFHNFYAGLFHFSGLRNLLSVMSATALIWLAQAFWIYALFCSLGLAGNYHLGAEASLVLVVLMGVAVMIPSSPGYIGTFHLITLIGLNQMGVPRPESLSFALLAHAHAISIAVLVGLYSLWRKANKSATPESL